jgi:hypothetical protein
MYDLQSFSPELFFGPSEPYDASELCLNAKGKPTTVWSAICHMKETESEEWDSLEESLNVPKGMLTEETVLDMIKEYDTCSNLSSPLQIYI